MVQISQPVGKRKFPRLLIIHNGVGAFDRSEGHKSLLYALPAGQGYNFPGLVGGGRQNEEINV